MRNFITKIKTVCENTKTKAEILMNTAILTTMSAFPAYADLTEDGIKTAMGSVIDTGFLAASMLIFLKGAMMAGPALVQLIESVSSNNPDQKREAGNGLAAGIGIIAVAGLIFVLKGTVKGAIL